MTVPVRLVEALGSETLVHFDIDASPVVAREAIEPAAAAGSQQFTARFDPGDPRTRSTSRSTPNPPFLRPRDEKDAAVRRFVPAAWKDWESASQSCATGYHENVMAEQITRLGLRIDAGAGADRDSDVREFPGISSRDQRELIQAWIDRHTAGESARA